MSQTGQNSIRKPTLDMVVSLAGFIAGVLAKLSFERVERLLKNKTALRQKLHEIFEIVCDEYADVREEWETVYYALFGVEVDFSDVRIPPKPLNDNPWNGSWRLIFVAKGLTLNATVVTMRKLFTVCTYTTEDFDTEVPVNSRTSSESYAVWVRDRDKPDEKYLGKSAREADPNSTIGMTLLERLVLEVKYFSETGKFLDRKDYTICAGSRDDEGWVPYVRSSARAVNIKLNWISGEIGDLPGGIREVVSL